MLEFKNVSYGWKDCEPLQRELCFHLRKGGILSVLGGNGSGKSSMLSVFTNPSMLSTGDIMINGAEFKNLSGRGLFSQLAVVSQNASAVYPFSVLDFVLTGWFPWLGVMGTPGKKEISGARDILRRIGIADWENRIVTTLSGGEFKLVQLARAMVGDRRLLLLDEVDGALDFANLVRLTDILCAFTENGGAVVLVTHNPNLALTLDSDVLILSRNLPYMLGRAADLIVPDILEKYFCVKVGQMISSETGCRQIIPHMHRQHA